MEEGRRVIEVCYSATGFAHCSLRLLHVWVGRSMARLTFTTAADGQDEIIAAEEDGQRHLEEHADLSRVIQHRELSSEVILMGYHYSGSNYDLGLLLSIGSLPAWRNKAACLDEDPELFFPNGNTGQALIQIKEAKAICRRCPVMNECRGWALETSQQDGVWGGMSEEERRKVRRGIPPQTVIP
jgi:WhiB family redox-sensing transcriptional regulator